MKINKSAFFREIPPKQSKIKKEKKEITDKFETNNLSGEINKHKKWLFMNYVAADCNLKEFQLAGIDGQETVGSDENTHIVALIDVGPEANPMDGWAGAKTFYITHDETPKKLNSPVISEHGKNLDMSDPKILKDFIVDTMKKFPADNVAIVLNDHGGGYTGAMEDSSDGDFMSVPNLHKALSEAEKETGKKIDILGFNACLMADTEAAYEFKDDADILLASEESEYGPGWNFKPMLEQSMGDSIKLLQKAMENKIDVSPEEFAKIVVKVNEENQEYIPTFSATDLRKMDPLAKSIDKLAKSILKSEEKNAIKDAVTGAESYGGPWEPYADMRDLHHIAERIEKGISDPEVKKSAKELRKTFNDAIIANEADPGKWPNAKGLHIYAPKKGSESIGYKGGYKYHELSFAKDTDWEEAIKSIGDEAGNTYSSIDPQVWPDGSPRKFE